MKYLLTVLLLITFNASAELTVKFGGWSKHSSKYFIDNRGINDRYYNLFSKAKETEEYNESHNGLGFDYKWGEGKLKYIVGAFYMVDSYNKDAYQIGGGISYEFNDYIELNVVATHFDRSALYTKKTQNGFVYDYQIKRIQFVYPLPYVTINLTKKMNMDIMALVDPFGGDSVIFARLGYTFLD